MKVAIYGQFYHKNSGKYIQELLDALELQDIQVEIEANFLKIINENSSIDKQYTNFSTFTKLDNSYQLFFSIGGDGTILKSINFVRDLDIPIVGINTGRLGFLATIQKENIKKMMLALKEKKYSISKRELITIATSPQNDSLCDMNFALNEIAISRKKHHLDDYHRNLARWKIPKCLLGRWVNYRYTDRFYRLFSKLRRPHYRPQNQDLGHNSYRSPQFKRKTFNDSRQHRVDPQSFGKRKRIFGFVRF